MLVCWPLRDKLTYVHFNVYSNNINKKMNKKALFLNACPEPVRSIRQGSGQATFRIDIVEGGSREI
jgi:hypothetical protein